MKAWNVFLEGKEIDTVFFVESYEEEDVRRSLIEHDGYDPRIKVELED